MVGYKRKSWAGIASGKFRHRDFYESGGEFQLWPFSFKGAIQVGAGFRRLRPLL